MAVQLRSADDPGPENAERSAEVTAPAGADLNSADVRDAVRSILDCLQPGATLAPDPGATTDAEPEAEPDLGIGDDEIRWALGITENASDDCRLGPHRIVRLLGAGGMGLVFQAEDEHLRRAVALKVLRPHLRVSSTARKRFLREARAAAALEHEHVAAIYHVDEERGIPYLVMPLLEGESLQQRLLRAYELPIPEVLRIGREAAAGLAAAHARGLIHRDVKPANIWLKGERGDVKLLDFGLARTADDSTESLTHPGAIVGTPSYMAPEQLRGDPADARSDLYGLGGVLYHMATGRLPFSGIDRASVHDPLPMAAHQINPAVPRALSDLISQLLSPDPALRGTSAQEVAATLDALARDATPQPARSAHRSRALLAGGAFVLLAALAGWAALNARALRRFVIDQTAQAAPPPRAADSPSKPTPLPTQAAAPPVCRQPLAFPSYRDGNYEIVLLDPDGTERANLTNHRANDTYPAWSPDGKHIAFESDRDGHPNLYVMDADGSNVRRLTSVAMIDTCPSWSPDGTRIVFQRKPSTERVNHELYTVRIDGSDLVNLTNHPAEECDPAWSPDGRTIVFTSNRVNRRGFRLFLMDPDGTNVRMITEHDNRIGSTYPAWSPDGRKIAYTDLEDSFELYLYDLDTTTTTRITNLGWKNTAVAWSPDGRTLAFQHLAIEGGMGDCELMLMHPDGSRLQRIYAERRFDPGGRPAWRPLPRNAPAATGKR